MSRGSLPTEATETTQSSCSRCFSCEKEPFAVSEQAYTRFWKTNLFLGALGYTVTMTAILTVLNNM